MRAKKKAQEVLDELKDIISDSTEPANTRIDKIKKKIKEFRDREPYGAPLPASVGFPTTL